MNSKINKIDFKKAKLRKEPYLNGAEIDSIWRAISVFEESSELISESRVVSQGGIEPVGKASALESGPINFNISQIIGQKGANVRPAVMNISEKNVPDLDLNSLIPLVGPTNTTANKYLPKDLIEEYTNATDAAVINYIDKNGSTKATIAVIKTESRAYEHDLSVCCRFKGYNLERVYPLPLSINSTRIAWFWSMSASKGGYSEEDIIFTALVDEDKPEFLIDSKWLYDSYPSSIKGDYDYVLNYQIRSNSIDETYRLLEQIVDLLKKKGTVSFENQIKPPTPSVFIKSARYSVDNIEMEIQSYLSRSIIVQLFGNARYFDNLTKLVPFKYNITIQPGLSNTVLPASPSLLDAVIFLKTDDFLDKVYVGKGFWFSFSDSQSNATLFCEPCPSHEIAEQNDLIIPGCAKLVGQLASKDGYLGMGYALNPNGLPVDITPFKAITFYAKGDGNRYEVRLETDSVKDYDYYEFTFEAPEEGKQYIVPIDSFQQDGWGKQVEFSGKDVKVISWMPIYQNDDQSVNLFIGNVSFTNHMK